MTTLPTPTLERPILLPSTHAAISCRIPKPETHLAAAAAAAGARSALPSPASLLYCSSLHSSQGVLLETTWNHLAKADRTPPPALVKEKFCMKLENDDYVAALACITSHSIPELQAFSNSAWLNLLKENAHRFSKDAPFRLIQEVSIHTNRTELSNLAVQNLISACKEFCRIHMTLAEIKEIETVCSAQTELAFKS